MADDSDIIIYQSQDGEIKIDVRLEDETVWMTQEQMGQLFNKARTTITGHIGNIFKEGELNAKVVCREFRRTTPHGAIEGKNQTQTVKCYNLDVVISVGYRVKSIQGTQFRIWATQRLKEYLIQGYSVNQKRFQQNAAELEQALALIKQAAQAPSLASDMGRGLVDIMGRYTQTFLWLQQYDEGLLKNPKGQAGGQLPKADDALASLNELKTQLMAQKEASDLFARSSKPDSLAGIFGNLDQTVFGEPAYQPLKARPLIYCILW